MLSWLKNLLIIQISKYFLLIERFFSQFKSLRTICTLCMTDLFYLQAVLKVFFCHFLAISQLKQWSLNSILNNSCQFSSAGWVQSLLNITIWRSAQFKESNYSCLFRIRKKKSDDWRRVVWYKNWKYSQRI